MIDHARLADIVAFRRAWEGCAAEDRDDIRAVAHAAAVLADERWDGRGTLRGYVYQQADRAVISWVRTHGPVGRDRTEGGVKKPGIPRAHHCARSISDPLPSGLCLDQTLAADVPPSDRAAERASDAAVVARAMRRLDRRTRVVLALRYAEDLTGVEIAARLGLSEVTVSHIHTAALARLRPALATLAP